MKERFFELIRMLSKNPTEFAKSIEISGAVLSSIKSGRTDLSMMVVTRTKEKYKNVNLEWLFTGEGKPFLDRQQAIGEGNDPSNKKEVTSSNNKENTNDYNFGDQELSIDENGTSVVEERAAIISDINDDRYIPNGSVANVTELKESEPVVYKPVMMVSQPEQVKKKISQIVIMYNDETYETLNKN